MSANGNSGHSHFTIFAVVMLFSALSNISFMLYALLIDSSMTLGVYIVAVVLCISFSALGQRLSGIPNIGSVILIVSTYATMLTFRLFFGPWGLTDLWGDIVLLGVVAFLFCSIGWVFLSSLWLRLAKRHIPKRFLGIASVIIVVVAFSLYLASLESLSIVSFFDSHPWVTALIGIVVSSVLAYIGGRRSREQKT